MATTGEPIKEHDDVPEYEPMTVPVPEQEPSNV